MLRLACYFIVFGVAGFLVFWFYQLNTVYGFIFFGLLGLVVADNITYHGLRSEERKGKILFMDIDAPITRFGALVDKFFEWLKTSRFVPRYDEHTLFLLALSTVLIIASRMKEAVSYIEESIRGDIRVLLIFALFVWSLYLSIYHAVSTREKTASEKTVMALFAAITNIITAYMLGSYIAQENSHGFSYLEILRYWHFANAIYLVVLLRMRVIGAESVSDVEARPWEVAPVSNSRKFYKNKKARSPFRCRATRCFGSFVKCRFQFRV